MKHIEYRVVTACVAAGVLFLGVVVYFLPDSYSIYHLNPPPQLQAEPNRDGTVLLTWSAPLYMASRLQAWEYQCAEERRKFGDWRRAENAASDRRLSVRSCGDGKLKTGRLYKFRVRIVFDSASADEQGIAVWPSNVAWAMPKLEVNRTVAWLRKLYDFLNEMADELTESLAGNSGMTTKILENVKEANQTLSKILDKMPATVGTVPDTDITSILQNLTKLIAHLRSGQSHLVSRLTEIKQTLEKIEGKAIDGEALPFASPCSRVCIGELYFPYASSEFSKSSQSDDCDVYSKNEATLTRIENCLGESQGTILVEGYASPPGSYGYNLDLAHRRALKVIDRLLEKNKDWRTRFKPVARGEGYWPNSLHKEECYQKVRVSICGDEAVAHPKCVSTNQPCSTGP